MSDLPAPLMNQQIQGQSSTPAYLLPVGSAGYQAPSNLAEARERLYFDLVRTGTPADKARGIANWYGSGNNEPDWNKYYERVIQQSNPWTGAGAAFRSFPEGAQVQVTSPTGATTTVSRYSTGGMPELPQQPPQQSLNGGMSQATPSDYARLGVYGQSTPTGMTLYLPQQANMSVAYEGRLAQSVNPSLVTSVMQSLPNTTAGTTAQMQANQSYTVPVELGVTPVAGINPAFINPTVSPNASFTQSTTTYGGSRVLSDSNAAKPVIREVETPNILGVYKPFAPSTEEVVTSTVPLAAFYLANTGYKIAESLVDTPRFVRGIVTSPISTIRESASSLTESGGKLLGGIVSRNPIPALEGASELTAVAVLSKGASVVSRPLVSEVAKAVNPIDAAPSTVVRPSYSYETTLGDRPAVRVVGDIYQPPVTKGGFFGKTTTEGQGSVTGTALTKNIIDEQNREIIGTQEAELTTKRTYEPNKLGEFIGSQPSAEYRTQRTTGLVGKLPRITEVKQTPQGYTVLESPEATFIQGAGASSETGAFRFKTLTSDAGTYAVDYPKTTGKLTGLFDEQGRLKTEFAGETTKAEGRLDTYSSVVERSAGKEKRIATSVGAIFREGSEPYFMDLREAKPVPKTTPRLKASNPTANPTGEGTLTKTTQGKPNVEATLEVTQFTPETPTTGRTLSVITPVSKTAAKTKTTSGVITGRIAAEESTQRAFSVMRTAATSTTTTPRQTTTPTTRAANTTRNQAATPRAYSPIESRATTRVTGQQYNTMRATVPAMASSMATAASMQTQTTPAMRPTLPRGGEPTAYEPPALVPRFGDSFKRRKQTYTPSAFARKPSKVKTEFTVNAVLAERYGITTGNMGKSLSVNQATAKRQYFTGQRITPISKTNVFKLSSSFKNKTKTR